MSSGTPRESTSFDIRCPHCRRRLRIKPEKLGTSRKCPACFAVLKLELVEAAKPRDTHATPHPQTESRQTAPPAVAPFIEPPTALPVPRLRPVPIAEIVTTPAPTLSDQPLFDFEEPDCAPATSRRARQSFGLSMRAKQRLVWAAIRFGLSLILICSAPLAVVFGFVGLVILIWWWPSVWLARHVCALLFSSFTCRGCGFEIDAVGQWSSGGFTDHRERHILLMKNPINQSFIGHTDCPQCGATNFV